MKRDKAKVRQNIWKAALRAEEERKERGEKQRVKRLAKLEVRILLSIHHSNLPLQRQATQRAATSQAIDMVDTMVEGPPRPDQKVRKVTSKGAKKLERRIRKRKGEIL
eukprot:Protomagalhaensia_sp_Gyna_25__3618@NODE_324_length_3875_cov_7_590198_g254_i0_p4_GENE_NODE_324_length_3875_cov_7_590198_g254_i0NODE_324_length_3875_cov_7_590198_g254_i0_p4_ORF_typecomplete_len108_score15_03TetR_C_36/PF18598_1/0_0048SLX9/PF15341_6/4_4_NODE_324_length_3875_cov_7_590198_g254_i024892812